VKHKLNPQLGIKPKDKLDGSNPKWTSGVAKVTNELRGGSRVKHQEQDAWKTCTSGTAWGKTCKGLPGIKQDGGNTAPNRALGGGAPYGEYPSSDAVGIEAANIITCGGLPSLFHTERTPREVGKDFETLMIDKVQ